MLSKLSSHLLLGAMLLGLSCFVTHLDPALAADAPATAPASAASPAEPIKSATFVPGQGFQVNGKPFFPILLYSAKTSPEELADFHKQGYNTLTLAAKADAQKAVESGFYLSQHAYPKTPPTHLDMNLFGIAMDSPMVNFKKDPIAKAKDDLAKVQKMIPDRPVFNAIGYWFNPADPDNEAVAVEKNLPTTKEQYEDLINTLDVSAPYLYPVPYQPITTVGDAVARAKKATGGKKAVLPILQLFTWTEKDRYPTPDELTAMAYLALAAGADGIGYYDYSYVSGKKPGTTTIAKEQPELWNRAGHLNREIGELFKIIGTGSQVEIPQQPGVFARAWKVGAGHLVLAANTTDDKKTFDIANLAKDRKVKRDHACFIPKSADDKPQASPTPQGQGEMRPREVVLFRIGDVKTK
jgi:hypothetical protein